MLVESMAQGWVKLPKSASYEGIENVSIQMSQEEGDTDRAPQSTQLPVQNTNNPILRRVEDQIVEFIIPMHDPQPRLFLIRQVLVVPCHKFIKQRYLPYLFIRFNIDCFSLCQGDSGEGFYLTGEVIVGGSEGTEAQCSGVK